MKKKKGNNKLKLDGLLKKKQHLRTLSVYAPVSAMAWLLGSYHCHWLISTTR